MTYQCECGNEVKLSNSEMVIYRRYDYKSRYPKVGDSITIIKLNHVLDTLYEIASKRADKEYRDNYENLFNGGQEVRSL